LGCETFAGLANWPRTWPSHVLWLLVNVEWIMTSVREMSSEGERRPAEPGYQQFDDLLEDKAWQHLGLTGQEFVRSWCEGRYADDPRPEVAALIKLMHSGVWTLE
jgi:hypothetical protein